MASYGVIFCPTYLHVCMNFSLLYDIAIMQYVAPNFCIRNRQTTFETDCVSRLMYCRLQIRVFFLAAKNN